MQHHHYIIALNVLTVRLWMVLCLVSGPPSGILQQRDDSMG